ncbi:MAG: Shikimate kinase [Clostridia bacterium 41_269]|nr:MAG: Shikimate kinase [Clostridia bacterium 41_269]
MREKDNIILIGFMGTGKTAVGKRLAQALGKKFIDTDKEIERVTGMTISQIFQKHGECRFRSEEKLALKKACSLNNAVIATGGGAVMDEENAEIMQKSGRIICLTARPEVIQKRVKRRDDRPLLHRDKSIKRIEELLKEREPYYKRYAEAFFDTSDNEHSEVVKNIIDYLEGKKHEDDQG